MKEQIHSYNERWDAALPGNKEETLIFAVEHFIEKANEAITERGKFAVALSGGSTPKAIFQKLSTSPYAEKIDWEKVYLFWSDERAVPPTDSASNYKMAMDAGFSSLPIPLSHIFRMKGEIDLDKSANEYEQQIRNICEDGVLDLILLGMGNDGHTASLFPQTEALLETDRLVVKNFIPQLKQSRLTLTYPAINRARSSVIYVLGEEKSDILEKVLNSPPGSYPIQKVGTSKAKALWIADAQALTVLFLH